MQPEAPDDADEQPEVGERADGPLTAEDCEALIAKKIG